MPGRSPQRRPVRDSPQPGLRTRIDIRRREWEFGDDVSVFFSMRGTETLSFRRAGGSSTWTGFTHDLTGVAPVSAADPVTGKAALVWIANGAAKVRWQRRGTDIR